MRKKITAQNERTSCEQAKGKAPHCLVGSVITDHDLYAVRASYFGLRTILYFEYLPFCL